MGVAIAQLYDTQDSSCKFCDCLPTMNGSLTASDVGRWNGLYHIASYNIQCTDSDDLQARSAKSCLVMRWGNTVLRENDRFKQI